MSEPDRIPPSGSDTGRDALTPGGMLWRLDQVAGKVARHAGQLYLKVQ
ncbi:MAG: hypothetical protein RRA15_12545 [bacterium]|nr:hypothetical protein [bacterium]